MTDIPDAPEGWTSADPAAVERARTDGGLRAAAAAALWRPGQQAGAEAQMGGYLYEVVDKVVSAILPLIAAQARQEERSKIAADLHAEGERERERLREVYGLGPDDNPCHVSAAINNAILGWAFAAKFVEGEQPKPAMVIRNQPRGSVSVSAPPATPGHADGLPNPPNTRTSPHMSGADHTRNPRNEEA